MGRSPCCDKVGLKKGPWTPEEDQKLLSYIDKHGHGSWRALPAKAGLQRCGKSCRLRWTNYLRPDIKRGEFSLQEEQTIIQLHALLGNRWSAIATHLPKRTDNEIKNFWNTHLKKRLAKMGIDPCTHKVKSETLSPAAGGHSRSAANLSHMAQWENARLEAEARLVRESKLRAAANSAILQQQMASSSSSSSSSSTINVLREWQAVWPAKAQGERIDLESPTSTLTFAENRLPALMAPGAVPVNDDNAASHQGGDRWGPQGSEWKCLAKERMEGLAGASFSAEVFGGEAPWLASEPYPCWGQFGAGFTGMLLGGSEDHSSYANEQETCVEEEDDDDDEEEEEEEEEVEEEAEEKEAEAEGKENNNYWNSILNAVNSSCSASLPENF